MEFVSFENLLYDFPPNELGNQFIGIMGPLTSFSDTTSFQVFMIFYYHVPKPVE
jgi:hypothetical protein